MSAGLITRTRSIAYLPSSQGNTTAPPSPGKNTPVMPDRGCGDAIFGTAGRYDGQGADAGQCSHGPGVQGQQKQADPG